MGVSENAVYLFSMASSISFNRENDERSDFSFSNTHSPTGSWITARFEGWTMLIERSVVAGTAQFLGARCFMGRGWAQKLKDRTSVASKSSKSQAEMRCSPAPQKSPVNCACCFDLCFTVSLFHQLGVISFVGIDATKTWLCLQAATPAQLRAVRALEKQTSMCKAWSCAWMT